MILIKCDFCFGPDPVWDYPAESFRLNEAAGGLSGVSPSQWGACATCHDLIEADDWAKVEARADHGLDRAYGYPAGGRAAVERRVQRDLARFRTHRTGPPVPHPGWDRHAPKTPE